MPRLFFAVPIPPPAARAAARVSTRLRALAGPARVSWVRTETLHLTLRFLGDRPEEAIPDLVAAGERAAAEAAPFEVRLHGGGSFPGRRGRPRVLWLGVRSEGALARLARDLDAALDAVAGIPPDGRPFRSHLTLGRVRAGDARRAAAFLAGLDETARFGVAGFTLYRSTLHPAGAIHEAVARFAFPRGAAGA